MPAVHERRGRIVHVALQRYVYTRSAAGLATLWIELTKHYARGRGSQGPEQ